MYKYSKALEEAVRILVLAATQSSANEAFRPENAELVADKICAKIEAAARSLVRELREGRGMSAVERKAARVARTALSYVLDEFGGQQ